MFENRGEKETKVSFFFSMEGQKRIRPANIVRREIILCKIFEDEFIRSNLPRTNQNLAKIALIIRNF